MVEKIGYVIAGILIALGLFYWTRNSCYAGQPAWVEEYLHGGERLSVEECADKIKFHKKEAKRIYDEVKDKVWWMPELDDRQKARRIFNLVAPVIAASGVNGKVVGTISAALIQYGFDCMDEWNWIQYKMHWMEYHAEQADFYERYLQFEARMLFYVPG